jgi:hypothetical protein
VSHAAVLDGRAPAMNHRRMDTPAEAPGAVLLSNGSDGPFDLFLGLPTHVLVVHAAVVLVPLAAIGAVLIAVSPSWRARLRWAVLAVATGGLLATFVAVRSGEEFLDRFDRGSDPLVQEHQDLGEVTRWWVLLFWLVLVAYLVLERRLAAGPATAAGRSRTWFRVVGVVLVLSATVATVQIARTGDAGSRAVWEQRVEFTQQQ